MIYRVFSAEADFKQAHPPLDAALLLPPEFLSARLQRDVRDVSRELSEEPSARGSVPCRASAPQQSFRSPRGPGVGNLAVKH